MDYFKLSLVLLLSFEFVCLVNSNPITSLLGKSDDNADDKAVPAAKQAAEATTASPSSSCGGLKGFLHLCDKAEEATTPPKNVKIRSVSEDNDSDSDSDESKSDEDSDEKKTSVDAETASEVSEATEGGIAKRQADDSETTETPEQTGETTMPRVIYDYPLGLKKREVDESDSSESDSDEKEEENRQRRDCRDLPEDQWKDCKK